MAPLAQDAIGLDSVRAAPSLVMCVVLPMLECPPTPDNGSSGLSLAFILPWIALRRRLPLAEVREARYPAHGAGSRKALSSWARWRDAASRRGSQVLDEPASAAQLASYQLHRTRCDQVYSVLDTVAAAEQRKIASLKRNLNVLLGLRHLHSWHVLQDFKSLKLALRKISDNARSARLGTSSPEALATSSSREALQESLAGVSQSSKDAWRGMRTPRRVADSPVITVDCESNRTGIIGEYHYKWHGSLRVPSRGLTSTSAP
ncbi:unnamed protein product [Prorocentrum cordatum]|uniref:Uncharacterized protein n=1 Tax=Prorocentrum cordatum TaxID=2364126 RepID=A0ABN9VRQ9_9DINO|nr:unnamed protein product [Polarella glacialis]